MFLLKNKRAGFQKELLSFQQESGKHYSGVKSWNVKSAWCEMPAQHFQITLF